MSNANGIDSTLRNGARIDTLVLVARLGQGTISIGSASWNTLDTLANFVATAVIVTLANLLANVVNTQFVRQTGIIAVTKRSAKLGMALEAFWTLIVSDTRCGFSGAPYNSSGIGQKSHQT